VITTFRWAIFATAEFHRSRVVHEFRPDAVDPIKAGAVGRGPVTHGCIRGGTRRDEDQQRHRHAQLLVCATRFTRPTATSSRLARWASTGREHRHRDMASSRSSTKGPQRTRGPFLRKGLADTRSTHLEGPRPRTHPFRVPIWNPRGDRDLNQRRRSRRRGPYEDGPRRAHVYGFDSTSCSDGDQPVLSSRHRGTH